MLELLLLLALATCAGRDCAGAIVSVHDPSRIVLSLAGNASIYSTHDGITVSVSPAASLAARYKPAPSVFSASPPWVAIHVPLAAPNDLWAGENNRSTVTAAV